MRLHEHEAARFFQQAGVPCPPSPLVTSADEAVAALGQVGLPVVLKAQVLVGSRGKHGGILLASTADEVREKAGGAPRQDGPRLRRRIRSWSRSAVPIARELYVGVTVDAVAGAITVILGTAGGDGCRDDQPERPEALFRRTIVPPAEFRGHEARALAREAGFRGDLMVKIADVLVALYRVFRKSDALIAEVNPLAVTADEIALGRGCGSGGGRLGPLPPSRDAQGHAGPDRAPASSGRPSRSASRTWTWTATSPSSAAVRASVWPPWTWWASASSRPTSSRPAAGSPRS